MQKGRIKRGKRLVEWRNTIVTIALLTLIFAYDYQKPINTGSYIMQAFLAVTVALLVNKISHKLVAKKFGAAAYLRLWTPGIVFGILLMLAGFKFPLVSFMLIHPFAFGRWGFKSRRFSMTEEGLNGLAGPCANILLAIALRTFPDPMLSYMSFVSAYFAIFNLLPLKPMDGYKLLFWKPWVWLFLVIVNVLIFFI